MVLLWPAAKATAATTRSPPARTKNPQLEPPQGGLVSPEQVALAAGYFLLEELCRGLKQLLQRRFEFGVLELVAAG